MSKPNAPTSEHQEDVKLEDILNSIRGIINDHQQSPHQVTRNSDEDDYDEKEDYDDEEVLELTQVMEAKPSVHSGPLVSESIRDKSTSMFNDFVKVAQENPANNNSELESVIHRLMKPMIKEWLDNNLLGIVEKIISEEVKKLIPKK